MGFILKCGTIRSHTSYSRWNNFKICMSYACIKYINSNIELNEVPELYQFCISKLHDNNLNLEDYLFFFSKFIDYIYKIGIIGIYYLLLNQENIGYYVYSNNGYIVSMMQTVDPFIDKDKINIIHSYKEIFNNSFELKKNIYIL